MAVLFSQFVTWHAVFLEARLAFARCIVIFIVLPGAYDVLSLVLALAQWPAHMVAHAGHRAKPAVQIAQRNLRSSDGDLSYWLGFERIHRAEVVPLHRHKHYAPGM